MNTPDIITTALFLSTATAGGAFCVWTWRASKADSVVIENVLAWSAAQRAEQATEDGSTPPGDREPAPHVETAPPVRLATVINFPGRRAA